MISPHRYAQQRRVDLAALAAKEAAEFDFCSFYKDSARIVRTVGVVPRCIPAKYHKRIMSILATAYLNALLKNSSKRYSVDVRHYMLNKALSYIGNVRESAGR